jgi:hypothetical protein
MFRSRSVSRYRYQNQRAASSTQQAPTCPSAQRMSKSTEHRTGFRTKPFFQVSSQEPKYPKLPSGCQAKQCPLTGNEPTTVERCETSSCTKKPHQDFCFKINSNDSCKIDDCCCQKESSNCSNAVKIEKPYCSTIVCSKPPKSILRPPTASMCRPPSSCRPLSTCRPGTSSIKERRPKTPIFRSIRNRIPQTKSCKSVKSSQQNCQPLKCAKTPKFNNASSCSKQNYFQVAPKSSFFNSSKNQPQFYGCNRPGCTDRKPCMTCCRNGICRKSYQ